MPRVHFHQQLAQLKDKLLAMAALSQQALESSVEAYLERDPAICQYVRENETAINMAQREVDEMSYELLAQEQPMAIDLRFILAVIKINGNLERIGDQAMSIAERTLELCATPAIDAPADIAGMREIARTMIRGALQALLEGDARLAASVIEMDDDIDRLNRLAHEQLIELIGNNAGVAEQALHTIIISRNLERIADYAANIASDVIFWIEGADIRHANLPMLATS
ncbi:phosphate signaling complex protein PhoU [Acidipila sp. EB88]|uniref:phosphate signaling complex protein PhoU n=1 Tax=Acidipila sp. EB88 TaxID=2305226 RepID=UPI000F5FCC81|nr:phosphate signaling complex protein PhoU [Acidipila sp. EB88]RRA48969.1 phosphate transport system regulatory protein PhoU [Acidipila sp. EB88]